MLGAEASTAGVLRDAALRRRFDELLEEVGFDLQATAIVGELSIARQQQVEILRALAKRARVFLFDEPTAALDLQDGERLLTTLTHLREAGRTVVLVSHFLAAVLRLADEVTILKDGRLVRSALAADGPSSHWCTVCSAAISNSFSRAGRTFPPTPPNGSGSNSRTVNDCTFDAVRCWGSRGLPEVVGVPSSAGWSEPSGARCGGSRSMASPFAARFDPRCDGCGNRLRSREPSGRCTGTDAPSRREHQPPIIAEGVHRRGARSAP